MTIYIRRREVIATLGGAATCALAPAFALAPAVSHPALAQGWPAHPVRIVVPYAPGGSTDTVARITADRLSRIWGQQVLIENKPGAGTNIGAAAVASSDPDGYTVFIGSSSLATSRLLYRSLSYALSDLAPATLVCTFPLLLLTPNSSPARSVAEFIAFARDKKGKSHVRLARGSDRAASGGRAVQTNRRHRDDARTISGRCSRAHGYDCRAGRPAGRGSAMLEQIRSGQVRGLAVTTAKRSQLAPELPSVAEGGLPGFDVTGWFAFFVPGRTSPAIVDKIYIDTVTALRDPAVKANLDNIGMVAVGSTPEELAALLTAEIGKWRPVIKQAHIALD